jgi:hypothetical protein
VDSEYFGVEFVRTAAGWAALTRRHEQALQGYAAYAAQVTRIGLTDPLEPWETARCAQAAQAVEAATRERAQREGRSWSYREALAAATGWLAAHGAGRTPFMSAVAAARTGVA